MANPVNSSGDDSSSSSSSSSELREDPAQVTARREPIPRMEMLRAKLLKALQKARLICTSACWHGAVTAEYRTPLHYLLAVQASQACCRLPCPLLNPLYFWPATRPIRFRAPRATADCRRPSLAVRGTVGSSEAIECKGACESCYSRSWLASEPWPVAAAGLSVFLTEPNGSRSASCLKRRVECLPQMKGIYTSVRWLTSVIAMLMSAVALWVVNRGCCCAGGWRTERLVPGVYMRRYRLNKCMQVGSRPASCSHGAPLSGGQSVQDGSGRQAICHDSVNLPRKSLSIFHYTHTHTPQQVRAAWGPKSPGWLLLCLIILHFTAAGAAPQKPRVVEVSTTSTGAIMNAPHANAVEAKHCGKHLATAMARKRAYRRACHRVEKAGPEGQTWYRGRLLNARQLGIEHRPRHSTSHTPNKHATNRRSMPLQLSSWPPIPGAVENSRTSRQFAILSVNLGGLTAEGYDEFCQWLERPETVRNVDVICVQETWRLSSDYLLPHWSWISSGAKPVSGQGVAVLVNRAYADPSLIRTREVTVGRVLQVQVPAKADRQGRMLNIISVYIPAKVSESRHVYEKCDACWHALNQLLHSVPGRHFLCMAGDFNTDLLAESPIVGTTFKQRLVAQDQHKFQAILRTHRLHALNTWQREATYVELGGAASRVDFIIARARQAKGHQCKVMPHLHFASWRQGARHLALAGYVDMQGWTAQTQAIKPHRGYDKEALARACHSGPEQEALHSAFKQVQHKFTLDLSPAKAETELIKLCCDNFPLQVTQRPLRPWQQSDFVGDVQQVWDLRKRLKEPGNWSMREGQFQRQIFQQWVLVHRCLKQIKILRKNSRARRKEHWEKQLGEAEQAEASRNPLKFFQVINRLAPRKSTERVQIRGLNGCILSPVEEAQALAEYWKAIYKADPPYLRDWHLPQPLDFTWNEIRDSLQALKARKANAPHTAPAGMWKALATPMASYLERFLHQEWTVGRLRIPRVWTSSYLHFLTKPNKPARRAQDMRPIALQSPAGKAITSVLRDRLRPHFNEAIRNVPQYAYVMQRSTIEAIARVAQHCAAVRQQVKEQARNFEARFKGVTREPCIGGVQLAIDLTKAFDLLPRAVLHTILAEAGGERRPSRVRAVSAALVVIYLSSCKAAKRAQWGAVDAKPQHLLC